MNVLTTKYTFLFPIIHVHIAHPANVQDTPTSPPDAVADFKSAILCICPLVTAARSVARHAYDTEAVTLSHF